MSGGVVEIAGKGTTYAFDHVFPPTATQADVFAAVAVPVLDDVLLGFNGSILAYGQTGTGKTYTLGNNLMDEADAGGTGIPSGLLLRGDGFLGSDALSPRGSAGLIPRTVHAMFAQMARTPEFTYSVSLSYCQIYCEMVQDLLFPSAQGLTIRESPDRGVYIQGLSTERVASPEDCVRFMAAGNANRVTAFTAMNATSSRSHACLVLRVERRPAGGAAASGVGRVRCGKLTFVDLAGSERIKKTGAMGARVSEAKAINLSLTCLGNVIHALTNPKSAHVPYRDSKLTRLLQDSLGGNARTSLVVTVGPDVEHTGESVCTMLFGQRAMRVQNRPVINEEIDYKALCGELQTKLDAKDDEIHELQLQVGALKTELVTQIKARALDTAAEERAADELDRSLSARLGAPHA